MSNKVVISGDLINLIIDYDNNYLKFNEWELSVPFSKITGIELNGPGLFTCGRLKIIVDGKRYFTKTYETFWFTVDKKRFPQLDMEARRLAEKLGVEIRGIDRFNVPKEVYEGQFKADAEEVKKKEYRMKCNVCGKIFCFTEDDLEYRQNQLKNAVISSIGAVANAAAGSIWASNELNKSADRQLNNAIDYSRCPECNSTDLTLLSEEEFEAIKTQSQSSVQEPKKTLVEQMAEYKQLLDMGVITQEEFDAKKKQLLGL